MKVPSYTRESFVASKTNEYGYTNTLLNIKYVGVHSLKEEDLEVLIDLDNRF